MWMGWNGHLWKWVVHPPNCNFQRENNQLMGMSVVAGREVEESDLPELWMLSRNWMEKIAGFTSPFSKNHPVNRIEIKPMDMSWNVTCHSMQNGMYKPWFPMIISLRFSLESSESQL
jgi:hypothetical protein